MRVKNNSDTHSPYSLMYEHMMRGQMTGSTSKDAIDVQANREHEDVPRVYGNEQLQWAAPNTSSRCKGSSSFGHPAVPVDRAQYCILPIPLQHLRTESCTNHNIENMPNDAVNYYIEENQGI